MYESTLNRTAKVLFSCVVLGISLTVLHAAPDEKLTPVELVAKHVESIGSAEARAKVRGTRIKGNAMVTVKLQSEVRPALVDWIFNLNQFEFKASLDPAAFSIGHEQKN